MSKLNYEYVGPEKSKPPLEITYLVFMAGREELQNVHCNDAGILSTY
jgi:hypothetical protein